MWTLIVGVLMADWVLPRQYDIVFVYLLAHFFSMFFREKNDVLLLAVITTVLTLAVGVMKPRDASLEEILLERLVPILSFWATTFFVVQFIALRDKNAQQEERFRALFRYATNGILLANQCGVIVMANPSLEQLFGYAPDELIGQPVEALIPKRLGEHHEAHRAHYAQQPTPRSMGIGRNLKGLKKDQTEFPVEVSLSPFKSSEGSFVMAFVVDNTIREGYESSILEQREKLITLSDELQHLNQGLEQKVTERTAELEQAKNDLSLALSKERELGELKNRFVSMASHEFRTPLTTVLSSASLIEQYSERKDPENVKKHIERIKNAIRGLNSILSEFLSLGRLEEGRVEADMAQISIETCIQEVLDNLKHLLKPGQTLETDLQEKQVWADPNLVRNILINLVSNAIKYSPENKPIRIKTARVNDRFRLSVTDEGMGIPEADQKHLFDLFFRASNAANTTKGTGLGLYIVQQYARLMGGEIGFVSELGQGSTFWVELRG
jgi:PAS domain S-box-containing protein